MTPKTKSTHEMPGSQAEVEEDDGVVNDSLGTVDPADSTARTRKRKPATRRRATLRSEKIEAPGR
jgi:hypothetical protein